MGCGWGVDGVRIAVRIAVRRAGSTGRPQRFVVYEGRITTPHHYAAVTLTDAVEGLLRREQSYSSRHAFIQAGNPTHPTPSGAVRAPPVTRVRKPTRSSVVRPSEPAGPSFRPWSTQPRAGAPT